MRQVLFTVRGNPTPKGSSRAVNNKRTGRAILVPSESDLNKERRLAWDAAVRDAARLAVGAPIPAPVFIDQPLLMKVVFRLKRPAGHYAKSGRLKPSAPEYPHRKPDTSKLLRATEDALSGLVYDDDARIVCHIITKLYALPGAEGADISVEPVNTGGQHRVGTEQRAGAATTAPADRA